MSDTEASCRNVCKGPCIGRRWLRPENEEEGINQFLNRYRGELFSGVANAAISYNVVNVSLSLASMELNNLQSRAMEGEILSMMLAGMIVSQIVFGGLGDLWGRTKSLAVALSICTVASIASACITSGQTQYTQLLVLRFILGVGAGGTYSLLSGVGYLSSPLVMLLLLAVSPRHYWPQLWRWHLGLGSTLLVMLLLVIAVYGVTKEDYNIDRGLQKKLSSRNDLTPMLCATSEEEEVMPMDDSTDGLQDQRSTVSGIVSNEGSTVKHNFSGHHLSTMISSQLKWKCLVGTAGAWFLFDVCFYGTTLAVTEVLAPFRGSGRESLLQLCWQDLFLKSVALPGYFFAVYLIGITSLKRLQIRGLLGMTIMYLFMGMAKNDWLPGYSTSFVVLFSVGALLGTIFFPSLTSAYGDGIVLITCAIVGIFAILVTHFFVEDWNWMGTSFIDEDESGHFIKLESEESLKTEP